MNTEERLGPIVHESRRKVRIKYAPTVDFLNFIRVVVWDEATKYYTPIDGIITPMDSEVLDWFVVRDPDGEWKNLFARQLDSKLFMIDDSVVTNALLEPGKGNTQHFWLQEI